MGVLAVPFAYMFNFFEPIPGFYWKSYEVGPHLLLDIPNSFSESILHPNFAKIKTVEFWTTVISILIITSIESLAIAKAVDKIDPTGENRFKQRLDWNWVEYNGCWFYRWFTHHCSNYSKYS